MQSIDSQQQYFEASFNGLDLQNETCVGIEFEDCSFVECNVSETAFEHCNFINCSFSRCQLSLMRVPYTRCFALKFLECKLVGVDWTRATWSP